MTSMGMMREVLRAANRAPQSAWLPAEVKMLAMPWVSTHVSSALPGRAAGTGSTGRAAELPLTVASTQARAV